MTIRELRAAVERAIDPGDAVLALPDQETTNLFYAANRGSLDAAKRLHDALLPGWWATMRYSTRPLVTVGDVDDEFRAQDDCLSRAWLLAILRALEGK